MRAPSWRWFLAAGLGLWLIEASAAERTAAPAGASSAPRSRRILYNLDGDSCLTLTAGRRGPGPITTRDLTNIVDELTRPGSQVDTLLLCVNAQVMYYPTRVGTMRGADSTLEERSRWSAHEYQRFTTVRDFFKAGTDPYAVILGEARRRGLEGWLTFRMNDAHGNDFLRTAFWSEHPEFRLGSGALDFSHAEVRDYVYRLIEEAVQRYDCDGLELDFLRFPRFFKPGGPLPADQRVAVMSAFVERVRQMLDAQGLKRGRRFGLAARAPSGMDMTRPTYASARELGCDVAEWARRGWIDFLTVSEWLYTADTLVLRAWKDKVRGIPIYAAIQPETLPSGDEWRCLHCLKAEGYQRVARERWTDGADAIYLFNFFTTREWRDPTEPPFEVLSHLAGPSCGGPSPELAEVRKIWDAAPHNAFTDLLRHSDQWWCVFREGSGHIPGTNGIIRVLRSAQGTNWSSAARVALPGTDLRDPKLSLMPGGRLMLLMGGSVYGGAEAPGDRPFVRARTHVAFSTDGLAWSDPQPVSVAGEWLWRVTWHKGEGFGFGYTFLVPAKDVKLSLWRTPDGVHYQQITVPKLPPTCWPDETTVRFQEDDTMIALVRNEQPPNRAWIGVSRPPYTQWEWRDSGWMAQGPNLTVLPDGRMFYGGRDSVVGPCTAFGSLSATGASRLFTLPSGGDTSYPGLVWHEGHVWMSYYSSHEGKAAIYLARIRVP